MSTLPANPTPTAFTRRKTAPCNEMQENARLCRAAPHSCSRSRSTVETLESRQLLAVIAPTEIYPGVPTSTGIPTYNTPVPNVRWQPVSGASGYGVLVSKLVGSTYTTVYNSEASQPFPSPIVGTSFTPPVALGSGTFRWQVRAFDNTNTPGAYAPPLYFTLNSSGYNRAVGIDISHYQTVSSWATVKTNGTSGTTTDDTAFVYAKATEGFTYDDPSFSSFASGAANAGIPFGAYHFARPGNNSAITEAQHFYGIISSRLTVGNLVPMLDFEDGASNTVALGRAVLSQWLNDFCDAFYGLSGLVPIVYTYPSYATSFLDGSAIRYPLWMATYPSGNPANPAIPLTSGTPSTSPWPSGAWSMWQYTSNRTVAGISSGNVDADVSNSDIATFYGMFKILSNTRGSIAGTLFDDVNQNGTRDAGENGIGGRTVYLDANNNGALDTGEAQQTTSAGGAYTFTNLAQGTHFVRQIVPAGFAATGASVRTIQLAAGQVATTNDFGSRAIDVTPPFVTAATYDYETVPSPIVIVFSEALQTAPVTGDFDLVDTSPQPQGYAYTLTYNSATRTATITPTAPLPNGNYRVGLPAGTVQDPAGNANIAYSFDFFVLAGDVNRDRTVNFDDLLIVAQNYESTGMTYAQGDLDNSGTVDFDDLLTLAQNYEQTVAFISASPGARSIRRKARNDVLR